ncbi:MAG TPA: hypothetical protein VGD55_03810 [Acidothermaceae bacterium]
MFTRTDKMTSKLNDTVTARVAAARQLLDAKVIPYAVPAGRKAAKQVRQVVGERIVPVVDNARVASAPARAEAFRRGRLAAAALRGGGTMIAKKRRRWPVALVCLGLGGALGAGAAWLAQAGKPVQLTPYPLDDDTDAGHDHEHHSLNGSHPLDLTDESHAHH